jgi:hypothetical protein
MSIGIKSKVIDQKLIEMLEKKQFRHREMASLLNFCILNNS